MTRIEKSYTWLLALIISMNVAASALADVAIKLRGRTAPHGSVVRLGDVAEISSDDPQQARQLGALPLMPAPAPGTERYLRTREIEDMLAAQGIEVGDFRFCGVDQVAISATDASGTADAPGKPGGEAGGDVRQPMNRRAAILAGFNSDRPTKAMDDSRAKELRQRLNRIVLKYLDAKTGRVDAWKIECDVADQELAKLNVATSDPVCQGGSEPWTGRQRFLMSFATPDGQVQMPIFADVAPPAVPVVVAIRPIARGDVIKAADIEMRTVDSESKAMSQRAVAESVEKLIGMEARQSIQAGEIVFADQVQSPILVKRGDLITVTSQSGGIRVRTSARAMKDGAHGELVQVESLGSRQKYDARIVGPREAAVFALSRPEAPEQPQRVNTARR
jgi:flagella basal body P-ring formation protein FlgA